MVFKGSSLDGGLSLWRGGDYQGALESVVPVLLKENGVGLGKNPSVFYTAGSQDEKVTS